MRTATPLWKVLARAIGAVVLVFALVIGVLAIFGDNSKTEAASVQVGARTATPDSSTPTSTAPVTTTPTTTPPEVTPEVIAPPAPAVGSNVASTPTPQAPTPAADPAPPAPTNPPPPVLNPKVIASGAGTQVNITLIDFPPNSTITLHCGWLASGTILGETPKSAVTNASGQGNAVCGPPMDGATHGYGVANGIHSNHAAL